MGLRKKRDCTIYVSKTMALITPQLISFFVFAYDKSGFSHDKVQIMLLFVCERSLFKHEKDHSGSPYSTGNSHHCHEAV